MKRPSALALAFVAGLAPAFAPGAGVAAMGCARGPVVDERDDARAFDDALGADQALEASLRDVDALGRGDDAAGKKAADLLESKSIPLADRVVERASAVVVKTAWGKERRDELVAVAHKRREELPRYARALREGDLKAKLEALEAQLELQRKAMEAASRVSRAPQ